MTDDKTINGGDMAAFERLLASYGSDRTRWPAPQRLGIAGLLATSAEAQRLYREAEALDRLLDLAPVPAGDRSTLVDRIAAAAFADAPAEAPRWQSGARKGAAAVGRTASARGRGVLFGIRQWPAASLLAASLVLGTFAGFSGVLDTAVAPLVVAASGDGDADGDASQLALGRAASSLFEEDLL